MSFEFIHGNCFDWMETQKKNSITAIITDPPYGVKEYTELEIEKKTYWLRRDLASSSCF